jgi:4-hydroxy-3-methylbut-2-en-1-yl diphosphate reductase
MAFRIEKAAETGFCFGVKRAIEMLEKAAGEQGKLQTLGAVVHNEQVLKRLSECGISVAESLSDIEGGTAAISAHGVSPQVEAELKSKNVKIIDTTCPFVRRAQLAACNLSEAGFLVVVFGDALHPEVKGILGWAQNNGLATLDINPFATRKIPLKIGILSQTTQIPENFNRFVKEMIDLALTPDAEIRVLDTLCHGTRKRQTEALELAKKVDLMLVIGGKSSANTRRLLELCSAVTETHQIGQAEDIRPEWLQGKKHIGVTSGTSTSEQTIDEVIQRLRELDR